MEPLVVTYIASHPNSTVVQQRLWALNRELVLRGMVALYQKDATTIARVLDVSQVGAPGSQLIAAHQACCFGRLTFWCSRRNLGDVSSGWPCVWVGGWWPSAALAGTVRQVLGG